MSGYYYSSSSGYSDHVSEPVSVVSYHGGGARTYVTQIEERIQEVRRPAIAGYAYSSAMKAVPARESRPPEVDGFINQILDEVNGQSGSTTRPTSWSSWEVYESPAKVDQKSDYGAGQQFGPGSPGKGFPGRDYGYDYGHGGSPVKSEFPKDYGDRYGKWDRPSGRDHGQPPERDYGVADKQWNGHPTKSDVVVNNRVPKSDSTVKPEIIKDQYRVPEDRQDTATMRSQPPQSYEGPNQWVNTTVKPQSPRDYEDPNNRWVNTTVKPQSPRDYEDPNNRWVSTTMKPQSPNGNEDPNNRWVDTAQSPKGYEDPSRRWVNTTLKPQSPPRGYEDSNSRWNNTTMKPQSPKRHEDPNNRWVSVSTTIKPQAPNGNEDPNNRWGNMVVMSQSPKGYEDPKRQFVSSTLKPQSPKAYADSNRRWDDTTMKPQSPKGYEDPNNRWDNRGVTSQPQSPKGYEDPENRWVRRGVMPQPQSPKSYEDPDNRWVNNTVKPESTEHYEDPDNRWGNTAMKPQSLKGYEDPEKRQVKTAGHAHDNPSQSGYGVPNKQPGNATYYGVPKSETMVKPESMNNQSTVPNNQRDNTTVKHQSSKGYEDPKNQWVNTTMKPKSPRGTEDPNNRWANSATIPQPPIGYEDPSRRWANTTMKPQSPKGYEDPNNQRGKFSNHDYDQLRPTHNNARAPDNRWRNSPLKPQSHKAFGELNNQYNSPNPIDDQLSGSNYQGGSKQELSQPSSQPLPPKGYSSPTNRWNASSSPVRDQQLPNSNNSGPNNNRGDAPFQPRPPKQFEELGNKSNPSPESPTSHQSPPSATNGSLPNIKLGSSPFKPQPSKGYGVLERSPSGDQQPGIGDQRVNSNPQDSPNAYEGPDQQKTPDQVPSYGNKGIAPSSKLSNYTLKSESPKAYSAPQNQWDRSSSSPIYEKQPSNNNDQLGNSPLKTQSRNLPMNTQSSSNQGGPNAQRDKQTGLVIDRVPPNGNNDRQERPNPPYTVGANAPAGARAIVPTEGNKFQAKSISNPSDQKKDVQPKDYDSRNLNKASGGNVGNTPSLASSQSMFASKTSPEGATTTYSKPASSVSSGVQQRSTCIDRREARGVYGGLNVPSRSFLDAGEEQRVLTCVDAVEKYNGFLI